MLATDEKTVQEPPKAQAKGVAYLSLINFKMLAVMKAEFLGAGAAFCQISSITALKSVAATSVDIHRRIMSNQHLSI